MLPLYNQGAEEVEVYLSCAALQECRTDMNSDDHAPPLAIRFGALWRPLRTNIDNFNEAEICETSSRSMVTLGRLLGGSSGALVYFFSLGIPSIR